MIKELMSSGYDSDPVKTWKKSLVSSRDNEMEDSTDSEDEPDYNYLLSMYLLNLTEEEREDLFKNRDRKVNCSLKLFLYLINLMIGRGTGEIAKEDTKGALEGGLGYVCCGS